MLPSDTVREEGLVRLKLPSEISYFCVKTRSGIGYSDTKPICTVIYLCMFKPKPPETKSWLRHCGNSSSPRLRQYLNTFFENCSELKFTLDTIRRFSIGYWTDSYMPFAVEKK